MEHICNSECDLVIALTESEAASHRAAGDRVEGATGSQYLVIEGYTHLAHFLIR